jgi:uncharacterized protein YchJ
MQPSDAPIVPEHEAIKALTEKLKLSSEAMEEFTRQCAAAEMSLLSFLKLLSTHIDKDEAIRSKVAAARAYSDSRVILSEDGEMTRHDMGKRKNRPLVAIKEPGRNDLCNCGSKRKYKKCCGK